MPKTVLGIQLTPGELLAVRLRAGWRGALVERVARMDLQAATDDRSAGGLGEAMGGADQVVVALSADEVFHREVVLPFGDLRRLELAAPLEAEESLPLPLEELVYDIEPLERSAQRSKVLVVAAPTERVGRLLTALRPTGLVPQVVDVEALALATVARQALTPGESAVVLDVSARLCQAVMVHGGGAQTFHAFSSAATEPALVGEVELFLARLRAAGREPAALYLCGTSALALDEEAWSLDLGLSVRRLPFPRKGLQASADVSLAWPLWAIPLGLALRAAHPRTASRVNLLRGPFAPPRAAAPWRQTAIATGGYAAALLALWGVAASIEASNRAAEVRAVEGAIRSTFEATLPDVKNIVSEVDQMRAKVSELEGRDRNLAALGSRETSPVRILRELSAAIPRDIDVELRDLSIDPERIRIEGATTSFRESERIKTAIVAADPRFASVTSDAKDGTKPGEVLFTLAVNLGQKR